MGNETKAIGNNGGLFYKSFTGKYFAVRLITNDIDVANSFCAEHEDCGVIDQIGESIIVAENN